MGAADHQSSQGRLPKETWLIRFGDKDWRDHLRQWAQNYKFHATLPAKLDRAEADWHAAQPAEPDPVIIHHPPEHGDNEALGGAMSIHAPWKRD